MQLKKLSESKMSYNLVLLLRSVWGDPSQGSQGALNELVYRFGRVIRKALFSQGASGNISLCLTCKWVQGRHVSVI